MPNPRSSRKQLSRSKSSSPLVSPNDERGNPLSSQQSNSVAFVPFQLGPASGVSNDTRRAVRVQAAKASAAARKRTIAKRLAEKRGSNQDEALPPTPSCDERGRRLSPASSVESASAVLTSSPSPDLSTRSSSPHRKDSHIELFTSYPTKRWHPLIPALVDHFLKYFAPDQPNVVLGREALRTYLWPMALESPSLFHAILLTAASHASISGALQVPMEFLAQLKHTTLESINEAVTDPTTHGNIGDSVIAAIALLGGWELVYGDAKTYDTHMRGLEIIVELRGGLFGSELTYTVTQPLHPALANLVLQAGNDMALCAGKQPYFRSLHSLSLSSSTDDFLPGGFAKLQKQHLLLPSLLHATKPLTYLNPDSSTALADLKNIKRTLAHWEQSNDLRSTYNPHLTVLEDTMQHQASMHVRLAGLSICEYMLLAAGAATLEPTDYLHAEIAHLQTELLFHTVYEEVTFWALFAICTVTGKCGPRHMRSLKRMQLEQEIHSWSALKALLEKHVYPAFILDSRAYALWEAIYASTIARDGDAGNGEPTRFKKGTRHPTTYLSRNMDSEMG